MLIYWRGNMLKLTINMLVTLIFLLTFSAANAMADNTFRQSHEMSYGGSESLDPISAKE
jgi:hypothetical protein